MTLLLDTHVFLWMSVSPERLNANVIDRLSEPGARIFLSAATALELSIKVARGKLSLGDSVETFLGDRMRRHQLMELPMTSRHAIEVGRLEWHHRDPFDRILVAQARCDDLTLVTGDPRILRYDAQFLDARL
ncbi:MAG: type II toxin-antitoxin system VapC family toxin [Candidatus Eisenbacteria bacterium]|nr:type II toxin-antitoxin system VapC family toxin [Candidatus Eisenbacteria bacterium]